MDDGDLKERLASIANGPVPLKELFVILNSDPAGGARNREASRTRFGPNRVPIPPSPGLLSLMWAAAQDRILIMLSIAATVNLGVGIYEEVAGKADLAWIEGVAIIAAVLIVITVNAANDWQKERQFRRLSEINADRPVTVTVDGSRASVSVFGVVVGDVVWLQPGDIVPADGLCFGEGSALSIDESTATGESCRVKKAAGDFLTGETKVLDGVGQMLVTAVGPASNHGRMLQSMTTRDGALSEATPLQLKLDRLTETIAKLGVACALLLMLLLSIRLTIDAVRIPLGSTALVERILAIAIQTVAIVVVAVPEGLPMAVTMALAYATTRMLRDKNLVRLLAACETMGTATTVCTDKTGTLTANRMSVVDGEIGAAPAMETGELPEELVANIAVNSTAYRTEGELVGSATEIALLSFLTARGVSWEERRRDASIVHAYPFSSERKSMSTIVDRDGRRVIYVKGASELVLQRCTTWLLGGKVQPLNRQHCELLIARMADGALRTIAVAHTEVVDPFDSEVPPLHGLTLVAILGIADPLRQGVEQAVARCQQAGIFIRMVTGDNVATATAIAKAAGILQPGGVVMEGARFRGIVQDEQLRNVLPRLQVLARASPMDKLQLVTRLRTLCNEIVAVTGDGTNDGPALHAANVGFAMGIAGTPVAKAAASIILMDDNFASIVRAVAWGRCVNGAVRKFLQFQLTVNITAVVIAFVTAAIAVPMLPAIQLLWINLIMDSVAALALATEGPAPDLLERHPDRPGQPLITKGMWRLIVSQSVYQVTCLLFIVLLVPTLWPEPQAVVTTLAFNAFVWMQLFNMFNARILQNAEQLRLNPFHGVARQFPFIALWVLCAVTQALLVQFAGRVLKVHPLDWRQWLLCLVLGSLSIPLAVIVRLLPMSVDTDETIVYQSRERIRWQHAYHMVRTRLDVYETLRRRVTMPTIS